MTALSDPGKTQPMDSGQTMLPCPHYCPACGQPMKPVRAAARSGAAAAARVLESKVLESKVLESNVFEPKAFECKACGVTYCEAPRPAARSGASD